MIEKFKNFSALYDESEPLKIDIIGETYCDKTFKIERAVSDLNALEFIVDGRGSFEIEGQKLSPVICLTTVNLSKDILKKL